MDMIKKSKKLNKTRGLTVPKDLAAAKGLFAGNAIDLVEVEDGILVRNHVQTCRFCGSTESVGTIMGEEVCAKCACKMREEINEKYA